MASETVPAAAPGPHDPANTAPAAGLAGALARIQPARTATFTVDPHTGEQGATTSSTTSSAAYHDDTPDTTPTGSANSSSGKNQQPREGAFKTLVRAVAERWRKGADIHIKRLDAQKARHQASQVKETRQVSVNNSGGYTPQNTKNSAGMGSGKGTGKTNGGGSGKTPKNSSSRSPDTSGGHSNSGRGSTDRNAGGGASRLRSSDRRSSDSAGSGRSHKDSGAGQKPRSVKDNADHGKGGRGNSSGTGSGAGKGPTAGPKPGSGSGSSGGSGSAGKAGKNGQPGKDAPVQPKATPGKDKATPVKDKVRLTKDTNDARGNNSAAKKERPGKDTTTQTPKPTSAGDPSTPASANTDKAKTTTDTGKTRTDKTSPSPKTPAAKTDPTTSQTKHNPTKTSTADAPPRTLASREAGYRDGHRAARITAHVQAYSDGARDGWHDGRTQAAHDKHRLDTARRQRKDTPMPTHAPTAGPHPIPVTGITDTHVHLPDGQAHTRGEIRNVKQYERHLGDKLATLRKIEDTCRQLNGHAAAQAAKAAQLAEQAHSVEGGDKLIATLTHLQEQATLQASIADELCTRAVRSADATLTLLCNIELRYGAIYKAVCDSETTQPAKLFWYKDEGKTWNV
jgi:hypothetical protein